MFLRGVVLGLLSVLAVSAQTQIQISSAQVLGGILGGVPSQAPPTPGQRMGGVPSGKPPGTISGKVINSISNQGIKRAVVNISGGGFTYQATTDASGAFHVENVEPIEGYFAIANCEGFENSAGNRGLNKPFGVQPSQDVKGIEVRMAPHASIAGKVTDRDGDPIENVLVYAMSYTYTGGARMLRVLSSGNTDDRGQFRLADVPRGVYYIAVNARNLGIPVETAQLRVHTEIPREAYPEVFYPSAPEPTQATPLVVKPGDDVQGIDFRLSKVAAFRVRGVVAGGTTAGAGRGGIQAQHCYAGVSMPQQGFLNTRANQDGTFEIADAVPGTYCINVGRPQANLPFGSATVEVRDRDIDNVVIQTAPGFDMNGVVSIDGTPPATTPRVNVTLRNLDFSGATGVAMAADMSLTFKNVYPVKYGVQLPQMQGAYVKSIRLGSQDVSDGVFTAAQGAPLLITLGTDPGQIDGTVQSSNSSASGAWVALYSAKYPARNDLTRTGVVSNAGGFSFNNLAPGDYKILVLESPDAIDSQNLDLRTALERRAVSVTLTGGGHQTVQVTSVSADDVEAAKAKIR